MTESEREKFYFRKKKENIEARLGANVSYPISDEITTKFKISSDKNVSWRDAPRGLMSGSEYEHAMRDVADYNRKKYVNGGKIVTYVDTPLEEAVGDPIK